MHLASITKVISLSLLTITAVVARPIQKYVGEQFSDSESPSTDREKSGTESDRVISATNDFSGPEFFPRSAVEEKRFLGVFKRKRQISCDFFSVQCSF
ncbi:hypothetical protein BDP27DRAFT_632709 [Rhodocollybia butyracea]|uniref:Uncharacterized protein n=1 Tax=Rhodocollybia butyracea TaxID=206335 RepID=A0A9P5U9R1_9AGAR|nr:hypothetical protein BDP27DRAFT_632709 [Rhodocollybia butyracea]